MIGKRYVVVRKDVLVDWKNRVPVVTRGEVPIHMFKVKGTPLVSQEVMAIRKVSEEFGPNHSPIGVAKQARRYYEGIIRENGNGETKGSLF